MLSEKRNVQTSKVKQPLVKADGKIKISKAIAPKKKSKVTGKRNVEAPQDVSEVYLVVFHKGGYLVEEDKQKAQLVADKYRSSEVYEFLHRREAFEYGKVAGAKKVFAREKKKRYLDKR